VHPLVEALVERRLPVLVHSGHPIFTLPWSIEELIANFPEARVVLGHMGHGNIVYINAAIDVAERHPNVYLETSGMPMHSKIAEAVERVGPHRVLYGSDAPFHHPRVEIEKVRVSGLPPDLVEQVLGPNAVSLFLGEGAAAAAGAPSKEVSVERDRE
jgi:predicted TIM-barrel fold metal-dependent hydrolase